MSIDVVVEQLAKDWVTIHPVLSEFRKEVELETLPGHVNRALIDWLRDRPKVKVRTVVGIVEAGSTLALHVWFDER